MKSILKIKNLAIVILMNMLFFSCENHVQEETIPIIEDTLCNADVSFVNDIKPIVDANCIECHGGTRFPDLRTYEGVSNSADRVKTQVVNRTMPQGGSLSNDQIELIRCWIENGALNN